jgi:hypothetical protein
VLGQVDDRPVRQVQHCLVEDRARGKVGVRIDREPLGREVRHRALRRRPSRVDVGVAFAKQHERHVAAEQTRGGDDNPFEHRPGVGRRLADDAQDFGRRGLPSQRLTCLVHKPRVLHCDQRLARERLRKRDLPVGEGPHLVAGEAENAHDLPVIMQRDDKACAGSLDVDACDDQQNPLLVGLRRLEILDVEERSILSVASHQIDQRQGHWQRSRTAAGQTGDPRRPVLDKPEGAVGRVAQPRPLSHNRVEHRREVAGRGVDDLKHLRYRGLLLARLGEFAFALRERGQRGLASRPFRRAARRLR